MNVTDGFAVRKCEGRPQVRGGMAPPRPRSRARSALPWLVAGLCGAGMFGTLERPIAFGKRATLTCPVIELRSVSTSSVIERARVESPGPLIEVTYSRASKGHSAARGGAVQISALGPVLGSMDSRAIRLQPVCTRTGIAVAATVTRSAQYHGGALQNAIWRPRIVIVAHARAAEASVRIVWRMRLTNGKQINRATTPSYPAQDYPASVSGEIHSHGRRRR